MKALRRMAVITVVSLGLMVSGLVVAQGRGWQNGPRNGQQNATRPGHALRTEMFQARIDVLAELTQQSKEEIQSKLRYKPMWAILDEFKINYSTFHQKLQDKIESTLKLAVEEGKITQDNADAMLGWINREPGQRRGKGRGMGYGGGRGHRGGKGYFGHCPWQQTEKGTSN